MLDALLTIRNFVSVLRSVVALGKGTSRTKKAAAVAAITVEIENSAALTDSSVREFVKPPSDGSHVFSWNSLEVDILVAMAEMCEEATKKKRAAIKGEHVSCLKALIKSAHNTKLSGVIRCIVPALLTYLYQWLQNINLHDVMAEDIRKVLRDVLAVDDNRAMLSHGALKKWAQVCVEQIVARGEFYFDSPIVSNYAHEAFVLLVKPTPTFDVLT